jgi:S1-C subfamily serine protease
LHEIFTFRREPYHRVHIQSLRVQSLLKRAQAPGVRLPRAPLGRSTNLEIGEELLAIAYPLGLGITATKGILSGAEPATTQQSKPSDPRLS